jgi:hypothetical protein
MPTPVQVVNEALIELGQDPIAALAGTDEVSIACNTVYADTRDAVLLLYPWKFATYQIGLPVSAFSTVFKWGHIYELPDGVKYGGAPYCLKVLATSEGEGALYDLGQHLSAGRILWAHPLALGASVLAQLAATPYAIEYTGRIDNLDVWDLLAIRILVLMLAANLAKAMTGQTALAEEKLKEALALLPAAQKEQDAQGVALGLYPNVETQETPLRILNQALALVGQEPIRSATEDSQRAYQARLHLQTAMASVLSLHPWNFASFQCVLSPSAFEPPMRWRYAYLLPDGVLYNGLPACVKVLGVAEDNGGRWQVMNDGLNPTVSGTLEGRVLVTDTGTCTIDYIGLVANLAVWHPLALEALTAMLAARMALSFTKDATLGFKYEQQALVWIKEAQRQDAKEGTPIRLRPNMALWAARQTVGGISLPGAFQSMAPGRTFGLDQYRLRASEAILGGTRLVATGVLPARTRIVKVVYDCTISFGQTLGLLSVDIGEATMQDRWGQGIGIVAGTQTSFGIGEPSAFEVLVPTDVWVSAVNGPFDLVGECQITVYWERLGPS